VITACPLCAFNLDNRQKEIKAKYPAFEQIPVLYFTQLMAIAFDLEKITYGFDLNYVDPEKLFQERKLVH
jgi:heterodisulfide reductase subunit B